jgi:Zn-dependent protease
MASLPAAPEPPAACAGCGTELGSSLLACPRCHRLVHAVPLGALAAEAETAQAAGDLARALAAWRRALELLPPDTEQSRRISARVGELSQQVSTPTEAPEPEKPTWLKGGGVLTLVALALWKFKFVVVFLFSKLKFLVLGLGKMSTVLSMFLSVGVYWTLWGWRFAVGVVLAMYVHEMGHVFALRRYGIAASAPMFVPGLGAFVRLNQKVQTDGEDARVGLAGPVWGLAACVVAWAIYYATGAPIFGAIGRFSAWLNLFNLLPVWQLDGGRGFRALSRPHRWMLVAAIGLAWGLTHEGLLALLFLVAAARAWGGQPAERPDTPVLVSYVGLVLSLALLSTIPVPVS